MSYIKIITVIILLLSATSTFARDRELYIGHTLSVNIKSTFPKGRIIKTYAITKETDGTSITIPLKNFTSTGRNDFIEYKVKISEDIMNNFKNTKSFRVKYCTKKCRTIADTDFIPKHETINDSGYINSEKSLLNQQFKDF